MIVQKAMCLVSELLRYFILYSPCKEMRCPVCHRLLIWFKSVWTHYGSTAAPFECWSINIIDMLWMLHLNADLHDKRFRVHRELFINVIQGFRTTLIMQFLECSFTQHHALELWEVKYSNFFSDKFLSFNNRAVSYIFITFNINRHPKV